MKHIFLVAPAAVGIDLAYATKSVFETVQKESASAEMWVAAEKVPAILQSVEADSAMEAIVGIVQESSAETLVVAGVSFQESVRAEQINMLLAAALDADVVLVADSDESGALVAADFALQKIRVAFVCAEGDCAHAEAVKKILDNETEHRISQAEFRRNLIRLASRHLKRIVLPEGAEPRTLKAAIEAYNRKIAIPVLIAKKADVEAEAARQNLTIPDGFEIIEPTAELAEKYVPLLVELRKAKGMTEEKARETLKDSVFLGTMMLKKNEVDGLVSGAVHSTADTVRPALQIIKCAHGVKSISSVFFVCLPSQTYVFGDCAINLNPTDEELAGIAIQSYDTAKAFGIPARVAMLSYGTGKSGKGDDVELVVNATQKIREARPDIPVDGPLQYDAATTEDVARLKAPESKVAGKATVCIFPDLSAGNICYKAVQRSAPGVIAVGPMLQGLAKPVNDLSRGALVEDIVYTIALTSIQAQA